MRVMHVITRMIVGGAQENTLWNCLDLMRLFGDEVLLVTGPTDGPEGRLLEQGRAGELPIRTLPDLIREVHPWKDYLAFTELRRLIRSWRPEVVHTHSAKGGFLGRLAAAKERVPAIIHTVHGAPFHPYQPWLARESFRRLERYAARRCHALISVADAMTDLLVANHVALREKFCTIYSGMDVKPFLESRSHRDDARKFWGFDDDDLVVGKIARLFRLKGHDDLLDAAREAVRANPRIRFLLVGDGTLRTHLEQRVAKEGLSGHVIFAGLVPPERIPYCLSAMDMLVHTSLREGLARTLPQALLSGIPVVSYDIDGAREVCVDGKTGRLVAPRDTNGLGKAILELCASPELRDAMGSEGRERCRARFPHETMTREIRQVYARVLEGEHHSG